MTTSLQGGKLNDKVVVKRFRLKPLHEPVGCTHGTSGRQNIVMDQYDIIGRDGILVDFHAEGTSEKRAMGYLLDGKASAVWGTHTHVQTSDAAVLPKGTGYITDLGMTGPVHSVLGIDPEQSIGKFMGDPPRRYESAKGPCKMEGCIFTIDTETGRCRSAEAIRLT